MFGRRLLPIAVIGFCGLAAPVAQAGKLVVNKGGTCSPADPPSSCRPGLWIVADDGGAERQFTRPEQERWSGDVHPSWSPDGRAVVFEWFDNRANDGALVVADVATGARRRLVERTLITSGRFRAADKAPEWSPRGDLIAFSSARGGGPGLRDSPGDDLDVFVVRSDGTGLRRVAGGTGDEESPRFSPDGSRIVFFRAGGGAGGPVAGTGPDTGTYSVDLETGRETRAAAGEPWRASLSPSGRFVAYQDSGGALSTMRADGSDVRMWSGRGGQVGPRVTWSYDDDLFYGGPAPGFAPPSGPTAVPYSIYRLSLTARAPRPVAVIGGSEADWTAEAGVRPPRDLSAPAAFLVERGAPARATARARRPGTLRVSRGRLRFFAADATGLRRLDAAVGRRVGSRCRFRAGRRWTKPRSCRRPVFRAVASTPAWTRGVRRLRRGSYLITLRATDIRGNRSRRPLPRRVVLR